MSDAMTITDLGDFMRASPMAFRDIPSPLRAVAVAALLPADGFTEQQRAWLARWWLACTSNDVDAINAALPLSVRVSPIEIDGLLYLGADLLTDALDAAGTYHAALPVIETLVCTYIEYTPPTEPMKGTP